MATGGGLRGLWPSGESVHVERGGGAGWFNALECSGHGDYQCLYTDRSSKCAIRARSGGPDLAPRRSRSEDGFDPGEAK